MSTNHGTSSGFDAQAAAQQMIDFGDVPPTYSVPVQQSGSPSIQAPEPPVQNHHLPVPPYLPDSLSDRGNAKLFVRLNKHRFRYVDGIGWYSWEGYRWKRGGGENAALWAAGDMAEELAHTDATGIFSDREVARHRARTLSASGQKNLLLLAKAHPELALNAKALDGDPYALCTPGGVVNLKTGVIAPADPYKDFHSRSTSVAPQGMPTPRWHQFLADTFGEDAAGKETIKFVHLLLGYSITGDVGAQVLPFLHGAGKNGKSALLDVVLQLLGDYADAAPPGFLMARMFEEHSTELTELHGRRIIVCSELKAGDRFDEARVKLLTGGDTIKARRMRQDFFSFEPTHHLWLLGNHKPEVTTGGYAFWRRMRLIPFERTVPDERKIDNLARVLVQEEGPGILHWLIRGAVEWCRTRDPLNGPAQVRTATESYAANEDHIGRFLQEECVLQPQLRTEQTTLNDAYVKWCANEAQAPAGPRAFSARVRQELRIASASDMIRANGRKFYPGIGLQAADRTAR
ncbi:phage/plasmid primase, P4 family [Streptomyces sp. NPDC088354]|uniref:DNA primase family protein n=1 Tax=Streptomyces sp. NPDC088354 TaxID=3365856 RepID=UPI0038016DE2